MAYDYKNLNQDKALIWRIVHRANLGWILANGLHCPTSTTRCPDYRSIGNADLIDKRQHRSVPIHPGGTLADYVPFYFTPFSVMMFNILMGRGVQQRSRGEIVILVSSLPRLQAMGIRFVYTNAHAIPSWTDFYSDPSDLSEIDWTLLRKRDFARDSDDPRKIERYQAEALVHRKLPINGLLGIICYTEHLKIELDREVAENGSELPVHARPGWYF